MSEKCAAQSLITAWQKEQQCLQREQLRVLLLAPGFGPRDRGANRSTVMCRCYIERLPDPDKPWNDDAP